MKKILLSAMMLCGVGVSNAQSFEKIEIVVTNPAAGQLQTTLGWDDAQHPVNRIKVKGPINATDMACLRDLTKPNEGTGNNPFDVRMVLDLSEAYFVADDDLSFKVGSRQVKITDPTVVPSYCFSKDGDGNSHASFAKVILPPSIETIDSYAFSACKCLAYIIIGENVTEIKNNAFESNENMRGVFITEKNNLQHIYTRAFSISNNTRFTLASVPEKVARVEQYGISTKNIKKLYVNGPTSFGDGICNTVALSELHILSEGALTYGGGNCISLNGSSNVYVPFGSLAVHKTALTGSPRSLAVATADAIIKEAYLPLPSAASHGETWSTWSDAPGKYYTIPAGVDVYTVNGYAGGVVNMASVSGSIPAEGCVINANAAGSVTYTEGTNDPTTLEVIGVLMMEEDQQSTYEKATWQKLNEAAANATKAKAKSLENGIWLYTSETATVPTINGTNYLVGTGTGTAEVGPVVEEEGVVTYRNFYLNWYNLNAPTTEEEYALGFYRAAQSTLDAHKAYLRLPASVIGNVGGADLNNPAASQLRIVFNEELTTGIAAAKTETTLAPCYNLQGQRVNAAKAGLYIQNGKKVIR